MGQHQSSGPPDRPRRVAGPDHEAADRCLRAPRGHRCLQGLGPHCWRASATLMCGRRPLANRLRAPGQRASSGTGSRCRSQYRSACRGPVRAVGAAGRSGQDATRLETANSAKMLADPRRRCVWSSPAKSVVNHEGARRPTSLPLSRVSRIAWRLRRRGPRLRICRVAPRRRSGRLAPVRPSERCW